MHFFNLVAGAGLGRKYDVFHQNHVSYGQGKTTTNINSINGNLYLKDHHKTWIDRGVQLDIGFIYNSQDTSAWKLNQGKKIVSLQGSQLTLEEADGHKTTYQYDQERECYVDQREEGGASTITLQDNGQWIGWNPATGITDYYEATGRLQESRDAADRFVKYTYNNEGKLSELEATSGQKIILEYADQEIKLYSVENDQKTLWMDYFFDEKGRICKTIIPNSADESYEINYGYDNESGLLSSMTQSDGTCFSLQYVNGGDKYQVQKVIDGSGREYQLFYNSNVTQVVNPLQETITLTHDENERLIQYQDANHQIDYAYDELKRVKQMTYLDGTQKNFSYDSLGFHAEVIDRNGNKTQFVHDSNSGVLLSTTQFLVKNDTTQPVTTYYGYDAKRQLCYEINAMGRVIAREYDNEGNCINKKDFRSSAFDVSQLQADQAISLDNLQQWCQAQDQTQLALMEWEYNSRGQAIKETTYANINADGEGIFNDNTLCISREWDIQGNCLKESKRNSSTQTATTTFDYDGLSRLIKKVDALGQETTHVYQNQQKTTTFLPTGLAETITWDAAGLIQTRVKAADNVIRKTSLFYDDARRAYLIQQPDGGKNYIVHDATGRKQYVIDPKGYPTESRYDINDNVIHTIRYGDQIENIDESLLKQGKWTPAASGDKRVESTLYDAENRLRYSIDGDNFVVERQYDTINNNIAEITYKNSVPEGELPVIPSDEDRKHAYFYDLAKYMVGEQLASGHVLAYHRNLKGELLDDITYAAPRDPISDWDAINFELTDEDAQQTYELNARGQCLVQYDAENYETQLYWDAAGRLVSKIREEDTESYDYDELDRPTTDVQVSGLEIQRRYHPTNKVEEENRSNVNGGENVRTTKRRYDAYAQVTQELSPCNAKKLVGFDPDSKEAEQIWENESVKHFYTDDGLHTATQDELGNTTYFYYNANRQRCLTINPRGAITEYTYDAFVKDPIVTRYYANFLSEEGLKELTGGLIQPSFLDEIRLLQNDALDEVETDTFNKRSLLISKVDGESFSETYTYNAFRDLEETTQQIDQTRTVKNQFFYDKKSRKTQAIQDVDNLQVTETWEYQDENRLVIHTDANGGKDNKTFDRLNREIHKVDALNAQTDTKWDYRSRLVERVDALG
ncbi:MAG: RHS repeat protein, partial [Gammaproteobacteria bacterium]